MKLIMPLFLILFYISCIFWLILNSCLDPSLTIEPVFKRFNNVIITSGTLSPLDMYPKMLRFDCVLMQSYNITLTRTSFLPLVN